MGLLKPYQRKADEPAKTVAPAGQSAKAGAEARIAKKQGPTPTRRESEEARRQRLHPNLSKAEIRARDRELRAKERVASFERAEGTPVKILARDYIDSRRSLCEWSLPMLASLFGLELLMGYVGQGFMLVVSIMVWVLMAGIAVDVFMMWRGFKRLYKARIPNESLRGVLIYCISRAIYIRRFRRPAPRVKPGDKI
ncbi:MAG: DUF3043 domain-containing protein [Propionibacteriaceae bacterium]|jgi:hypothetical protein|nr:DUF3043 domain-containing protein [Propionibacteriaceae bacterium]